MDRPFNYYCYLNLYSWAKIVSILFTHIFRMIYGWKSCAARWGTARSNVLQFLHCCCPLIHSFLAKSYVSRVFGPFLDKSPVCKRRNREIGRYGIPTWLLSVLTYVCAICTILSISCVKIHATRWFFLTRKWPVFQHIRHILMWPSMNRDVER